jgi:hypothetical protein
MRSVPHTTLNWNSQAARAPAEAPPRSELLPPEREHTSAYDSTRQHTRGSLSAVTGHAGEVELTAHAAADDQGVVDEHAPGRSSGVSTCTFALVTQVK